MYNLCFRQVHLDFHTSPHIVGIGKEFDKRQWQQALREGHIDSITCFSKCHHGWSYHPTNVGRMHPHLEFDLLRAQFDAAKEIGVNVPLYVSAGFDDVAALEHPEWREISIEGKFLGRARRINEAGFKKICFNSPYLDYLCEQAREAVRLFPDCDGIFSDIILQGECCCKWCMACMEEHGLDAEKPEDRQACAKVALERYYRDFTAACRSDNREMPVFHNSGHVDKSRPDLLQYFSHLELESLPTGGWGYDHYPVSAKYAANTGLDFLGMTGKFHTTWGEFGGYKHPNALRYECAQMLAFGSKCSVGDQLHPSGLMDMTTYKIIGEAYSEVEAKEPWCNNVRNVADIAVLSSEAETGVRDPDTGAGRILLEGHFLFDVIDRHRDFLAYRLLVLPDVITVDDELKVKLDAFLRHGGKLLLTGKSGLMKDGLGFAVDTGAEYFGESQYQPDYLEPGSVLAPSFIGSPLVMYMKSQQVKPTIGEAIAGIRNPYFNRTWRHYCSHQHAPASDLSEYAAAVKCGNVLYLAHPIYSIYNALGAVAYKEYAVNAIKLLLGENQSLKTNLPSTARVSLTEQESENRFVLHLLYANTISRGASVKLSPDDYVSDSGPVEVIEELLPLDDVEVSVKLSKQVKLVTHEPQGKQIPFETLSDKISLRLNRLICHEMVVLHY